MTGSGTAQGDSGAARLRAWATRLGAFGLLYWVLDKHGGGALIRSLADQVGWRWSLLLVPWAAGIAVGLWAYVTCLPRRGKDMPLSVVARVHLAGGALNELLPLGKSSSNIMKVGLMRHWYSSEALVAAGIWGSLGSGIGNMAGALGPVLALGLGYGEVWTVAALAAVSVVMGIPAIAALVLIPTGLIERVTRLLTIGDFGWLRRRREKVIAWSARLDVHLAAAVGERSADFRQLVWLRLLYQVFRVFTIWLAIELLAVPGGLMTALLYNAMSRGVTQILRFVPARLGVMELGASAMFIGLGLDGEAGVALALLLRVANVASLVTAFSALSTIHDLPERFPPRTAEERALADSP